jgi:hypothetical protein
VPYVPTSIPNVPDSHGVALDAAELAAIAQIPALRYHQSRQAFDRQRHAQFVVMGDR